MTNKVKGEFQMENGTRLVMDFNAMATYEDITGKPFNALMDRLNKGTAGVGDLRALCYSMMRRHEPKATIDDAGDLLESNLDDFFSAIGASQSEQAEDAEVGNGVKAKSRKR